MSQPRLVSFTAQDHNDFANFQTIIRKELDHLREGSARRVRIGQHIFAIRQRKLWKIAKKPYEKWLRETFDLGPDQARKYYCVGEELSEKDVAGTDFSLDVLEQIALAHKVHAALWQTLLALAQSIGPEGLRRGRLAGEALLRDGAPIEEAIAVTIAAAGKLQGPAADRAGQPKTAAQEIEAANQQLKRVQRRIDRAVARLRQEKEVPVAQLAEARSRAEALVHQLDGLLADRPAPAQPERRSAPRHDQDEEAPAAQAVEAPAPAAPAPAAPVAPQAAKAGGSLPLSVPAQPAQQVNLMPGLKEEPFYAPILAAVASCLSEKEKEQLEEQVYTLMHAEHYVPVAAPYLAGLYDLLSRGGQLPQDVFDLWLKQMCQPDWESRGLFAFGFYLRAQLPGYRVHVRYLAVRQVPRRLRRQAQEAADEIERSERPTPEEEWAELMAAHHRRYPNGYPGEAG